MVRRAFLHSEVGINMAFKNTQSESSFLTPGPAVYSQAQQEVLPVHASEHPVFDLLYHPLRWGWIAGRWLPQLRRLVHSPGSQNVDKDGSMAMAHAIAAQGRWIVIPHDVTPEDYVVSFPARGGRAHYFRWERIKILGGRLTSTCDEKGYADWLSEVVDLKRLSPDPSVIQWKIEALEAEIERDEAGSSTDLKAAGRAKKMRVQLEAMKKALEDEPAQEEPAPEPVQKRAKP